MGIPGILKEIGRGERVALSKLAIDHLERHNRPLRIAIDAAIWNFQTQSGQGGKNPALRTLFFRLLRLLALPIEPVFVYDGKNKPLTKRGRTVTRYSGTCVPNELSKVLVRHFAYPWHVAPGEAEAECALLQKRGIVDVVMSQDVDAIMFGAGVTLRDWSKEGTKGNKTPTHVNVMDSVRVKEISGLDPDGMILIALLSGGDYDEMGVPGFGATLACEIARAGFGKDLIELVTRDDRIGLSEWRDRLQYELETNESGHFKRKHKTLKVPDTFPDLTVLGYYVNPAVSKDDDLPALEAKLIESWNSTIDVPALRTYTASMFDWSWRSGARRFVRCIAQPLFQDRLIRGSVRPAVFPIGSISERRQHFINDGIPELRLSAVPVEVVEIDIEAEKDNPEYVDPLAEEDDEVTPAVDEVVVNIDEDIGEYSSMPVSPSKKRKPPPWSPYVAEKWWVPETLLQLGLPGIVEDWHQLQRDIRADPKKFATSKAPKVGRDTKRIDASMKKGAIRGFFTSIGKHHPNSHAAKSDNEATKPENGLLLANSGAVVKKSSQAEDIDCAPSHSITRASNRQDNTHSMMHSNNGYGSTRSKIHHARKDPEVIKDAQGNAPLSQGDASSSLTSKHPRPSTPRTSTITLNSHKIQRGNMKEYDSTDGELPSEISVGASFSATLEIESSPPTVALSNTLEPFLTQRDISQVTQRKSRRGMSRPTKVPVSSQASPGRTRRPIESFFSQSEAACSTDELGDNLRPSLASHEAPMPSDPSTGLMKPTKSTALFRDSLPGTWKEIEAGHGRNKRAPRISYVDLTGD